MSRNGAGTYTLPAGQPVVTGTTISSATHNTLANDLANALTTSIATDGQSVVTANIPMGGFKITNLGAATVNGDAVRYQDVGALQQSQAFTAFTTAGTSTAYTLTPSPAITAYTAGQSFWVTFHLASGSSPTLGISAIATPPNLVRQAADGSYVNVGAGEIPINHRGRVTLLSATQAIVELPAAPRATRIDVASVAGTVDLTANAPNTDDIQFTGSNAMTGFTVAVGRVIRFVVATGASPSLVSGAAIDTQTGANVLLSPGDSGVLRATAANTVELIGSSPAVRSKLVMATRDISLASGTQTIAGAGFAPSSVQVVAYVDATAKGSFGGLSDGTSHSCLGNYYNISAGTFIVSNTGVIYIGDATNRAEAAIAFNSDGGVLTWTKTGAPTGTANISLLFQR